MANACIIGFFKSYTVFYPAIRATFPDSSAYHASWIPALFSSLHLITAPVSGALCQRFSSRPIAITGGLLCFSGLLLASFATSLNHLLLTLGLLTGLGGGFVTAPSILIVNKYFDKRRAFASGICVSGNAFGGVIMPPLVEFLLQEYGFRGTLVIMAAIQLNLVVAGFCFRPTAIHAIVQEKYRRKTIHADDELSNTLPLEDMTNEIYQQKKKRKRGSISSFGLDLEVEAPALSSDDIDGQSLPGRAQNYSSGKHLGRHYSHETDSDSDSELSVQSVSGLKLSIDYDLHDENRIEMLMETQKTSQYEASEGLVLHLSPLLRSDSGTEIKERRKNELCAKREAVLASAKNSHPLKCSNSDKTLEILSNNNDNDCKDNQCASCEGTGQKQKSRTAKAFYFVKSFFGKCFDFEVLRTTPMILMSMSGFFAKMGFPHTLFYLHAFFMSIDADYNIVTPVISGTSLVDVVGRLGIGALADTKLVPADVLYFGGCALAGSCILCVPFATTTASFAVVMCGYCLGMGSWSVLQPTILARNHGSDRLPASLGFVKMLMGVSNFVSPQISGALVDLTDSYASCYFFMGTSVLLASSLPLLSRMRPRRKQGNGGEDEGD